MPHPCQAHLNDKPKGGAVACSRRGRALFGARPSGALMALAVIAVAAPGCKGSRKRAKPRPVLELELTVDPEICREERLASVGARLRKALLARLAGRYGAESRASMEEEIEARVVRGELLLRLGGRYAKDVDDVRQVATQLGLIGGSAPQVVLQTAQSPPGTVRIRQTLDAEREDIKSAGEALAETFQRRLRALGVAGAQVKAEHRSVHVLLPKLSPAKLYAVKRVLTRQARLSFRLVDDESAQMKRIGGLVRALQDDAKRKALPQAISGIFGKPGGASATLAAEWEGLARVRVRQDQRDRQGRRVTETYLLFPARDLHFVRRLFDELRRHPALRTYDLGKDRAVAFGAQPGAGIGAKKQLRTFVLRPSGGLEDARVVEARAGADAHGFPIVSVRFDAAGGAALRELTRKNLGRPLAIVLNERVTSAPIIRTEIGARVQITLGGGRSAEAQQRDARDLATVLRTGSAGCAMAILHKESPIPAPTR